jgi:copper transport protein
MVAVVPAGTRKLEPVDRTRLLAATIVRFSFVAGIAVVVLLATGIAQAIVEVRHLDNLIDTAFGRAVLIKICLFVLLVSVGAYNRQRLVPQLRRLVAEGGAPRRAGFLLRRALRAEVALIVLVLGVTSALVSYPPASAVSTGGVFAVTRSLGPADLQLTVDPARVGPNEMHVFLTNKRDGRQFTGVKEFRVSLAQPDKKIGPIRQSVQKAGPGHWVMDGATFPVTGDWQVTAEARVSEFDAYYTKLEVPVR